MYDWLSPRAGLQLRERGGRATRQLSLSGELDLADARVLETAVTRACIEGVLLLSLDLEALTFIDASGLRAILRARAMCQEHGAELTVAPGEGAARRLLELTGTFELLTRAPVRLPAAPVANEHARHAA